MSIVTEKRCTKCGELKPLNQFVKNKSCRNGVGGSCNSCKLARDRAAPDYAERARKNSKKWDIAHPEQRKEITRKRYAKNPEKSKAEHNKWVKANLEKVYKRNRKWHEANPEKVRENILRFYVLHPDKRTEYSHKRRALELGNGGTVTAQEWQGLKEFYNFICLCCRKQEPEIKLTLDHVTPIKKGGANTIENSQPLCQSCNSKKGTKAIDYR